MIESNDFRVGSTFELKEGRPVAIVTVEHIKMARSSAVIKAKLKGLQDGVIFEQSFRSGEKYRAVRIEKATATYLYDDGTHRHFMVEDTYEQVAFDPEQISDVLPYLKENNPVFLLRYGEAMIGAELPITVELEITETDPGHKGDTVSGATKPAKVESGARVQVPLFVNVGDKIKIDTRSGKYLERA
ncbi:MAG: elongation factor P [Candidatus Dormibacteraceae bacterium]